MEMFLLSNSEAFDCLFTAIKKELERQKQLEKDFATKNPNVGMYNINCLVLEDFLQQLEEQESVAFLAAESVYKIKFNNES